MPVQAFVSVFWTPKRGSAPQEFEDAFWVGPDGAGLGEIQAESVTAAIADGASESILAGRWASRLVSSFGTAPESAASADGFLAAYRAAVASWDADLESYLADRQLRGVPVQWFEERGLGAGAYSTITIMRLSGAREETGPCWTAAGLGDSCLFQVRDEEMFASFPISDAALFSNQPPLLCSRMADERAVRESIRVRGGGWEAGDTFYLASDALAAWILSGSARGERPWECLRDLDTADALADFPDWVNQMRDSREIRNDDTTLIRIDAIRGD